MSRSRGWVFTINNYTWGDLDDFLSMECRYKLMGYETCPSTGTPHYQGYVYFDDAKTMRSVSKRLPRARLEAQRGTFLQATLYCKKDGKIEGVDYFEFGDPPEQGKVTIDVLTEVMKHPKLHYHLFHQYRKSFKEYQQMEKTKVERTKQRDLYLVHIDRQYEYARKHESVFLDGDLQTYDNEDVVFAVDGDFAVEAWMNGFPQRIRRGFEVIKVDPEKVYIVSRSVHEHNLLTKKYLDLFTEIYNVV